MELPTRAHPATLEVDVALLAGFGFVCRPDCGLCCFASPRLEREDESRLLTIEPGVKIVPQGGERCIAARPEGGACQFLSGLRCRVHAARPAPCREFPVSVHIGTRLQATVVLSCPGVPLDPLLGRDRGPRSPSSASFGPELASVRQRLSVGVERRRSESERRRHRIVRELEREGRWAEDEAVREQLRGRELVPSDREYFPEEPPTVDEGLERLPMYFDRRPGPVALARGLGGWEALELSPEGGSTPVGVAAPPGQPPDLEPEARELLVGYLRYVLARDAFLAAVHLHAVSVPEGSVLDLALDDLHAVGSLVLARGSVRARLSGWAGNRLARADVEHGIRATDQDWLDRPTWGSRL